MNSCYFCGKNHRNFIKSITCEFDHSQRFGIPVIKTKLDNAHALCGNEQLFCALAEIHTLYVSPCAPCQRLHSHFAGGYLFVPHICAGEHLRTAVSFIRVERLSLRDAFACCLCDGEFRIRVRQ